VVARARHDDFARSTHAHWTIAGMKTVRRLLYRDIAGSVAFVAVAFLALFFFIDFVDELGDRSARGISVLSTAWAAALALPGQLYELMPISVLIGTIYALSRMAQSSEFTILRTGGLGPGRALALLAGLGVIFGAITFVVGDWLAPMSERHAVTVKASSSGIPVGRAGAWLKERRVTTDGERSISINVAAARSAGELQGIRIFEFDAEGHLLARIEAKEGRVDDRGLWELTNVNRTQWPAPSSASPAVTTQSLPRLDWPSTLSANVVAAAVLPLQTMSTAELWRYSRHLNQQEQASQRYAIQFWKKALYPLACLVMVALALPFAYLHSRAGGLSLKVFGGIMLGISFVLLNNVAGHIGILRDWTPWVAAAVPSLAYLMLSLGAFAWLVRYR
jgi:lipopolysaccharide export system permease protein